MRPAAGVDHDIYFGSPRSVMANLTVELSQSVSMLYILELKNLSVLLETKYHN